LGSRVIVATGATDGLALATATAAAMLVLEGELNLATLSAVSAAVRRTVAAVGQVSHYLAYSRRRSRHFLRAYE
jgi:hypothetical protein